MVADPDDLLKRLVALALDAGESGAPLLEAGCQLLIRASKLSALQRSYLAQAGQLILTAVEDRRHSHRWQIDN